MIVNQKDFEALDIRSWKILVVDDDEGVIEYTSFVLEDLKIAAIPFEFLEAKSMAEAKKILSSNSDIALALVDVVMESNEAGLELVEYIRDELENQNIRILLRTGQPGYAPENEIVQKYEIDDYLDKSDLSDTRLVTSVTSAIRAYTHMCYLATLQKSIQELLEQRDREIEEIESSLNLESDEDKNLNNIKSDEKYELFLEMIDAHSLLLDSKNSLSYLEGIGDIKIECEVDFLKSKILTILTILLVNIETNFGLQSSKLSIDEENLELKILSHEEIRGSKILECFKSYLNQRSISFEAILDGLSLNLTLKF